MTEVAELTHTTPAGFEDFNVRVYGTVEDPLFVGKDIVDLLGIRMIHYNKFQLDKDYTKGKIFTGGQMREVHMFTEHGLYKIIYRARCDAAERFREYVTSVLKIIRLEKHNLKERSYKELCSIMADLSHGEIGTHLYIMQCRGNYKIGRSNNVDARLSTLQTGNPDPIVLYKSWKDLGRYERVVHIKAETFLRRGLGEWFSPRGADNLHELASWIDRLNEHLGNDE
jgi:prophage antirepressor-like protein